MSIQELQDQIKQLDDNDFRQLQAWVATTEKDRHAAQPAVEQAQADIVTELQDAGKLDKPEAATEEEAKADAAKVPEWKNPGVDHSKMYHYGDVVRYQGKLVRSTHQGLNHWEPGTLGFDGRIWEDITPDEEATPEGEDTPTTPAAPVWKPGVTYVPGEVITHNGVTYKVVQGHTSQAGWQPDMVPALFSRV